MMKVKAKLRPGLVLIEVVCSACDEVVEAYRDDKAPVPFSITQELTVRGNYVCATCLPVGAT